MRIHPSLRRGVTAAAALATVALLFTAPPATAADATPTLSCSADAKITKTLKSGSAWAMCATIHSNKGLVLEQIQFKPATENHYYRVLDSFYLSQLNVPYDTGLNVWDDLTSYGFGNQYLQKLSTKECPTGDLHDVHQTWIRRNVTYDRTIPAICTSEVGTGTAFRSHEQTWGSAADSPLYVDQGSAMTVESISKVDWYEYMEQVQFADTGVITASLGATGDVSYEDFSDGTGAIDKSTGWPVGQGDTDYAASHWHNAIWRADFGIDSQATQKVEQYDTTYTGETATEGSQGEILTTAKTDITTAGSFGKNGTASDDELTWFRVVAPTSRNTDDHARSYEINIQKEQNYDSNPVTQPQVTFTNASSCQEYASNNLNVDCKGQSIIDYVANSGYAPLTDPVAWINIGFHHVVRDEDQSPMETHWQSFNLVPRDFFAQSPTTPAARECINGNPGGELHSACIAPPNLTLPTITGDTAIGSKLTVSNGTWNQTGLEHTYQWYRGGNPIEGATTAEYALTGADKGQTITATVTAKSTKSGFSTTAEALGVAVGGPVATKLPAISGTPKVGTKLTVSSGTWDKQDATLAYQWFVNGSPVASATGPTYVLPTSAAGATVSAVVTATAGGFSNPATAPAVKVSKLASTTAVKAPTKAKAGSRPSVTVKVATKPSAVPTGTVTILHGSKVVGTAKLTVGKKGSVSVKLPRLKKGSYTLRAVYHGSTQVRSSKSSTVVVKVK